jgi:hypothetical protein
MKTGFKFGIAAVALTACIAGSTLWANADSEDEAIKEAFIGSQNIAQQIGHFESDNGKTDQLSEEQIQGYIDDFNAEMDKYYSSDNICRQLYKETNEQRLRKDAKDTIVYKLDGGVLDCTCSNIKLSADGTSATMDVILVDWGNWVEQNEYGQIEVTAPTGQDTMSVTMVKEDGQWKLKSIDDMVAWFGADAITDLQKAQQKASEQGKSIFNEEQQKQMQVFEEYKQKTLFTEYDSFSEALQAAESIDPYEINPFPLWNEMGGSSLEKYKGDASWEA